MAHHAPTLLQSNQPNNQPTNQPITIIKHVSLVRLATNLWCLTLAGVVLLQG
jgi:hypothetical protein